MNLRVQYLAATRLRRGAMSRDEKIVDLMQAAEAARSVRLSDAASRVVAECREIAVRTFPALLASLFDKLDDALFDMADKSDRDALQTVYFDVMRAVRKARNEMDLRFSQRLVESFDHFWSRTKDREDESSTYFAPEMALVSDDDLEESLAVSNMIAKGENAYRRELYMLNERFAHLRKGQEVDIRSNPLAPQAICHAFREAVGDLTVDVAVKLMMYKLFDKQVMHYVGGMYDEINALLAREGVLPNLIPRAKRNPVAPALRERREGSDLGPRAHAGGASPGDARATVLPKGDVLGTLRRLLDQHRRREAETGGAEEGAVEAAPAISASELVSALSSLQYLGLESLQPADIAAVHPAHIREALFDQFQIGKGEGAVKSIGPLESDIIDVVTMLFELVLEERAISDPMKVLIARLQIPVLKVALLDPSFFDSIEHPARRLVNNLARASIGWRGEPDPGKDAFYAKVSSIVDRVLGEFNRDLGVFTELDREFTRYVEEEQRGARVAEERAAQITRGREQLSLAKRRVAEEIDARLQAGKPPAAVVKALLDEAWRDVLLLIYLRQGTDSDAWREALQLAEDLLWSTRPKDTFEERQELLQRIPEILRRLREGLKGISFDQHRMTTLLKELQGAHIACLRSRSTPVTSGDLAESEAVSRPEEKNQKLLEVTEEAVDRPAERLEEPSYQQAAELPVGSWLDLTGADGRVSRAKLSWKSGVSDLCVLVDRRGVKVQELDLSQLAGMLSDGRAQPIEQMDVPLVDRALSLMMEVLRGRSPGSGRLSA
jgi:hypothetical protein